MLSSSIPDLPAEVLAQVLAAGCSDGPLVTREDAVGNVRYALAVSQVSRFWRNVNLNVDPARCIWSTIIVYPQRPLPFARLASLFLDRCRDHPLNYIVIEQDDSADPSQTFEDHKNDIISRVRHMSVHADRQIDLREYAYVWHPAPLLESFSSTAPDFGEPLRRSDVPLFQAGAPSLRTVYLVGQGVFRNSWVLPRRLTNLTIENSYVALRDTLELTANTLESLVLRRVVSIDLPMSAAVDLPVLATLELGGPFCNPGRYITAPMLQCVVLSGEWAPSQLLKFEWLGQTSVKHLVYAISGDPTRGGQYSVARKLTVAFPNIRRLTCRAPIRPLCILLKNPSVMAARETPFRALSMQWRLLKMITVDNLFEACHDLLEIFEWRLGEDLPLKALGYRADDVDAAQAMTKDYHAPLEILLDEGPSMITSWERPMV